MTDMQEILKTLQRGEYLSREKMTEAMRDIMSGACDDAQIAAFLMGLSMRGESVEEITAAAYVLRELAIKIKAPEGAIDCCGTGGDHSGTYNISTAVALVVAACGVPVAKHGNRAASSKSGTADVLEALGVNLDCAHERLEESLQRYNFAFLMAPKHHSAMKHVIPVRRSIAVRTVFNLIGPLANPAGAQFQLLGVYDRRLLLPFARVLQTLGTRRAWVVCGEDGLDEITVTGFTHIAILDESGITKKTIKPSDFGVSIHKPEALKGGDPAYNAAALRGLLNGDQNAYRDIVLANAAAALVIRGVAASLSEGVTQAAKAIDSGAALAVLENYISFTNGETV